MISYPSTSKRLSKKFSYIGHNHFILLVFNLLAPILVYLLYQTMVPQADTLSNPIIISIEANDRYAINTVDQSEQWFTLAGVRSYCLEQIEQKTPERLSIWLKSNPTITYGKVLHLIQWLNTKGITKVSLVTEEVSESEKNHLV